MTYLNKGHHSHFTVMDIEEKAFLALVKVSSCILNLLFLCFPLTFPKALPPEHTHVLAHTQNYLEWGIPLNIHWFQNIIYNIRLSQA